MPSASPSTLSMTAALTFILQRIYDDKDSYLRNKMVSRQLHAQKMHEGKASGADILRMTTHAGTAFQPA